MNHYYKIKYKKTVNGYIEVSANNLSQAKIIADNMAKSDFGIWDSTAQITRGKKKIAYIDYEQT
jgi:hypothetical protein